MTMLMGWEGGWEKAVINEKNNKNKESNFLLSMVMILDMADENNEEWKMKNVEYKSPLFNLCWMDEKNPDP